MPFIIPNATDIDGSKFIALDQSEPDSLDFQILGDRSTGVLTGCAVSTVNGTTIKVDQGAVAIQGVVHNVPVFNQIDLPTAPLTTTYRFDVVVARLNTTTNVISIVVISGNESTTNPTFPKTPSRLNSLVGVDYINIGNITENNPTTDVVLATVFRNAAAAISNACIVDKRVNVPSTTSLRGSTNPDNTIGNNGDLYYRTTEVASSSGVFIKTNGTWVELLLQNNSGSVTPVGSIIMWPSNVTTPNPTGKTFWLECNGDYVSNTNYTELKNLLGETYGPYVGTTFKLPNLSSGFIQGSGTAGSTGGNSSVSIAESNLPAHKHGLNAHQHPVGSHAHTMNHDHADQETKLGGVHTHIPEVQDGYNQPGATGGFVTRLTDYINGTYTVSNGTVYGDTGYVVPHSYTSDGLADGIDAAVGIVPTARGMQVHYTTGLKNSISHKHDIDFDTYTGDTGSLTTATASANTGVSTGDTANSTGTGDALSVIPPYVTMRWFIRAL
jgi:microcystin-dependent protein